MPRPSRTPLGLRLARAAKAVSRAFDQALADAGGSRPTWLVLLALKTGQAASQRQLAAEVGIQGATLTHHLDAMETSGWLTRRRDPRNRRVHLVELTSEGEALFLRLREAASTFDARLRTGLTGSEIDQFESVLDRLEENVRAAHDSDREDTA